LSSRFWIPDSKFRIDLLSALRLKLDENLSRHLKPPLIELGHDFLTAADENLLSRSGTEIAHAARHEQRMILTLDIEFADLRKYPPVSHPGAGVSTFLRRFPSC
jgi:hypothetical protein